MRNFDELVRDLKVVWMVVYFFKIFGGGRC